MFAVAGVGAAGLLSEGQWHVLILQCRQKLLFTANSNRVFRRGREVGLFRCFAAFPRILHAQLRPNQTPAVPDSTPSAHLAHPTDSLLSITNQACG